MQRFERELAPHFALEERLLLPPLEREGDVALTERTRRDHAQLRALAHDEQGSLEARLTAFGNTLRDHVRFEERVLFAAIESKVESEVLEAVAEACRRSGPTPTSATQSTLGAQDARRVRQ